MKMADAIPVTLIALCGMNCAVCCAHLREKKPCQGCRGQDEAKPDHCRQCKIKACASGQGIDFCFNCAAFPCPVIKRLDKSYRQRYQVSLIENALRLETIGARQFMIEEREKWTCPACGGVISLHDRVCSECGKRMM
jgi:hypothetical protein